MIIGYRRRRRHRHFRPADRAIPRQVSARQPNIIVQNRPGADGVTAMNYFVQQVKPDGLTLTMARARRRSGRLQSRRPIRSDQTRNHRRHRPRRLRGRDRKDAEKRLYDKRKPPVIMGAVGGVPRSGMQTTAWGIEILGWNAKWVLGYPGTNDLFVALERGEIDMTASSNLFQVNQAGDQRQGQGADADRHAGERQDRGRARNSATCRCLPPDAGQDLRTRCRSRATNTGSPVSPRQMAGAAGRHAEAHRRRLSRSVRARWRRIRNSWSARKR